MVLESNPGEGVRRQERVLGEVGMPSADELLSLYTDFERVWEGVWRDVGRLNGADPLVRSLRGLEGAAEKLESLGEAGVEGLVKRWAREHPEEILSWVIGCLPSVYKAHVESLRAEVAARGRETRGIEIRLADAAKAEETLTELPDDFKDDAATIIQTYGDLDHNGLLKTVYEKYPAYAKKSRRKCKRPIR